MIKKLLYKFKFASKSLESRGKNILCYNALIRNDHIRIILNIIAKITYGFNHNDVIDRISLNKNILLTSSSIFRPRYNTLVLIDITNLLVSKKTIKVIDMCCGIGTWGLGIACAYKLYIDINSMALLFTSYNILLNKHRRFFTIVNSNKLLFLNKKKLFRSFDIIVSNPPYIEKNKYFFMQKNILKYEPLNALLIKKKAGFL